VKYTEGTVLVGVADVAAQKVVFGGYVQGIVECGGDTAARIQSGVERIFTQYPKPD